MLHGGDIYGTGEKLGISGEKIIDFSANISPLGLPQAVRQTVIDELEHALHYPDVLNRRLCRAISRRLSEENPEVNLMISPDMILCGSGAADIIYRFVYARRPKKALLIHPAFVEYEAALSCVGTKIVSYRLNHDDFRIREDILDYITEDIDVLFVCNPNNPTGVLTERHLLYRMAQKAKTAGVYMVVDECFLDFVSDGFSYSMMSFLNEFSHILILRSFTKMFAMPGFRLGYGLSSDSDLIEAMRNAGQSWSVSTVAESAGIAALREKEYEKAVIACVEKEKCWLYEKLSALGIGYIKSHANYILIHVPMINQLYERLLKYGIMIRRCHNYVNLDETYYRIAVNAHEKNEILIHALEQILHKGDMS